jgi:hypothetical protein
MNRPARRSPARESDSNIECPLLGLTRTAPGQFTDRRDHRSAESGERLRNSEALLDFVCVVEQGRRDTNLSTPDSYLDLGGLE